MGLSLGPLPLGALVCCSKQSSTSGRWSTVAHARGISVRDVIDEAAVLGNHSQSVVRLPGHTQGCFVGVERAEAVEGASLTCGDSASSLY